MQIVNGEVFGNPFCPGYSLFFSPQIQSWSKTFIKDHPLSLSLYSTFGGIWGYSFLVMSRSRGRVFLSGSGVQGEGWKGTVSRMIVPGAGNVWVSVRRDVLIRARSRFGSGRKTACIAGTVWRCARQGQ